MPCRADFYDYQMIGLAIDRASRLSSLKKRPALYAALCKPTSHRRADANYCYLGECSLPRAERRHDGGGPDNDRLPIDDHQVTTESRRYCIVMF